MSNREPIQNAMDSGGTFYVPPAQGPALESMFGPVAKWGRLEFPLPDRAPEHGRDELAALIHGGTFSPPKDALEQIWRDKAYALADAIIAAGWRHQ